MTTTKNEIYSKLKLLDKMDNPFYVLNTAVLRQNINSFSDGFRTVFGENFRICYSVKTNPHPFVLEEIKSQNIDVEVVSSQEYHSVLNAGFKPTNIVYNGVLPDLPTKLSHIKQHGLVNVESLSELKNICENADPVDIAVYGIGIRLCMSFSYKSRFGIDVDGYEYKALLDYVHAHNIRISCVHIHVHGQRTLESWEQRSEFAAKYAKELGASSIDLGSNLLGNMDERLKAQFNVAVPSPFQYALAIKKGLLKYYNIQSFPKVIIEPGTALIGNAFSLVGKVVNYRERDEDRIATVNVSMYDTGFFRGSKKSVPFDIYSENKSKFRQNVKICGYACTEDDYVSEDYSGCIDIGDVIVIGNIGAYGYSLASDFICNKFDVVKL